MYDEEAPEVNQEFERVTQTFLKPLEKSSESNKSTKPSNSPQDDRELKKRVGFLMETTKEGDLQEMTFKMIQNTPEK